jgi:hypothetical protein
MVFLSPFKKGSYMKKLLVLLGTMGILSLAPLNIMAQLPPQPLDDEDLGLCWLFGDNTKDDTKMGEQESNGTSHNNDDEKSEESSSYFDAESNEAPTTNNNANNNNNETANAASSSSSDDDETMPNAPQASSSSTSSSPISSSSTDQSNIIKEGFCKRLARRVFAPCIAGYVKMNKACTTNSKRLARRVFMNKGCTTFKQKLSACKTVTCKGGRVIFCTKTGRCLFVATLLTDYAIAIKLGLCNDHVGFVHSLEWIGAAIFEQISKLYEAYKNNPPMHHDDL